jgi:hypothetical protein
MTNNAHQINSADVRRRQIRVMQVLFAGAAAAATLALFGAAQPGDTGTAVASGSVHLSNQAGGGRIIAVNDDDVFNPSSGDIFTQNAQDQSTANGAGT